MSSTGPVPSIQPTHDASKRRIELLAPTKDEATARAAILCGADAVYVGGPHFSAREAAGNALSAIARIVDFAHPYYVRVYVALNTLLRDDELSRAEKIARSLCELGIDGLIVQDMGLLELDLPPVPLIASTQMDNATPEKVRFLQEAGFSRVILARELTIDQIRAIRRETMVELECFVHGALCVGASGQCYMSYASGGRSGNRGQCAQPCRKRYTLKDECGRTVAEDRHLLSLKDLNLSDHLDGLIDAGVTSFKIEGRLKDIPYVANTVGFYRRKLDAFLAKRGLSKSSSGTVHLDFEPDPAKTFNRGFTDYGLTGKASDISSMDTPKSIGECVGTVAKVEGPCFVLDGSHELHNADGICFFDSGNKLQGTIINRVEGRTIYPSQMQSIRTGLRIYRNHDRLFSARLTGDMAARKIALTIHLCETPEGPTLVGIDEDGNQATVSIQGHVEPAQNPDAARQTALKQLAKLGKTLFACAEVRLETSATYFLSVAQLNAARRALVEQLLERREADRPRTVGAVSKSSFPYPEKHLTYRGNVLNAKARTFYQRHGVQSIDPAAEAGLDMAGRLLMTTKLCLRRELGLCADGRKSPVKEPWILEDEEGRQYEVRFRCGSCGMEIRLPQEGQRPPQGGPQRTKQRQTPNRGA